MAKEQTNKQHSRAWPGFVAPLVIAFIIAMLSEKAIEQYFDYPLSTSWRLVLYVGIYFATNSLFKTRLNRSNLDKAPKPKHPATSWPINGPFGRLGRLAVLPIYCVFVPCSLLFMFNPMQWRIQSKQINGQNKIADRLKGNEEAFAQYQTKVDYKLPFDGRWLIFNGGLTEGTSHSWDTLTQRYAYDFVKADDKFARHKNGGTKLQDYYCYAQPILAAADGEVISVFDGVKDAPFVGFYFTDFSARHIAGNHVIIKHADGEFGFYAHLIKGSIDVKPGDKVLCGQQIGLCGHSGNSTEPHLHFHLQDQADFFTAMGLPIRFSDIEVDGVAMDGRVGVERGQRVGNC